MPKALNRWNDLPLFANDRDIGEALLGRLDVSAWLAAIPLYEAQGLAKPNRTLGGRYTPAVKAFFDKMYGVPPYHEVRHVFDPVAERAKENPDAWNTSRRRKKPTVPTTSDDKSTA